VITYTKLNNGDWGLRGDGEFPGEGAVVGVIKQSGDIVTEKTGRLFHTGIHSITKIPFWVSYAARRKSWFDERPTVAEKYAEQEEV